MMTKASQKSSWDFQAGVLIILIVGIFLRIKIYGDPRLSVATNDTISYIDSTQIPLNSWEIFTGRRLLTTNLLYKLFEPENGYKILANGSGHTTHRVIQPGFDYITTIQFILSIASWSYLVLTLTKYINNPGLKILSAMVILMFAFTPQIAEWDSILMSESLMISLFALQLALLIRIVFTSLIETGKISAMLLAGWMIVNFLWSFVRDTNLYATPVTIALLIILLWLRKFKKSGYIGVMIVILSGIFMLGWITSRNSIRPTVEMSHVYKSDLLPFPLRVAELQAMGMPAPGSSTYQKWFEANSVNTFTRFMITHPGYVATKLGRDVLLAFGENMQQYFKIPELGARRELLIQFGNAIHPESATPFLMSAIILLALFIFGLKNKSPNSRPWGLIGMWMFMVASLTIFMSIMAGTYGLYRHTLFSTMAYRLFMWIFLIISLDLGFDR